MKLANIILLSSLVFTGCYTTGQIPTDDYGYNNNYNSYERNSYAGGQLSYETFYNELRPYGNWVNYPGYGNVWQPRAGSGFRPYETDGHWVLSVDGWAWVSDLSWGWAPFHYGRWLNDPRLGWAWVPGYEWAPAWVTWGRYNDYYAWAPLAPGISISFGSTWRAPSNYWSYVPCGSIQQHNLGRYITRNNRNPIQVNNITIINNYNNSGNNGAYHRGPDYHEVERYTHTKLNPVAITNISRPGATRVDNRNGLEIYRPEIAAANSNAINNSRTGRISSASGGRTNEDRTAGNILPEPGERATIATREQATISDNKRTRQQQDNNRNIFQNQQNGQNNLNDLNNIEDKRTSPIRVPQQPAQPMIRPANPERPQREFTPTPQREQRIMNSRTESRQIIPREDVRIERQRNFNNQTQPATAPRQGTISRPGRRAIKNNFHH